MCECTDFLKNIGDFWRSIGVDARFFGKSIEVDARIFGTGFLSAVGPGVPRNRELVDLSHSGCSEKAPREQELPRGPPARP